VLEGDDHVTQALAAGADDYLIKPTSLEEIEARLIVAARVTALHRERSAALSHRDTLLQVARDFAAEADPDRIVSAALAKVVRLLGVEHATLWYWDAADRVFTTARSTLWSGLRRLRLDQEHGLGQCVAATRRPMRVVDYAVEHPDDGLFVEAGMRSALAVPLHASDRLVGVLEAGSRVAGRGFSLAECETLELLAASLSSTLS
jgi:GAF domain-containing protein